MGLAVSETVGIPEIIFLKGCTMHQAILGHIISVQSTLNQQSNTFAIMIFCNLFGVLCMFQHHSFAATITIHT